MDRGYGIAKVEELNHLLQAEVKHMFHKAHKTEKDFHYFDTTRGEVNAKLIRSTDGVEIEKIFVEQHNETKKILVPNEYLELL